jgi:polyphosphate kinase
MKKKNKKEPLEKKDKKKDKKAAKAAETSVNIEAASVQEDKPTNKRNRKPKAEKAADLTEDSESSSKKDKKKFKKFYAEEMARLQHELVKMHEWIHQKRQRVIIIFEGRDAAGKGGVIKTISETLNPRICHIVALGRPTEREKSQWYFQRYVQHLPSGGNMVLFDRSWYNRGGVERVMGFCSEEEYQDFLRSCPEFERMLIRSGIILIKYWFSVSDPEQEKRFKDRAKDPMKLSPMDIQARDKWEDYSEAKDVMFAHTDTKQSPWYVVKADDKKRARLNCIKHLLSQIPYEDIISEPIELPERPKSRGYVRPPMNEQHFVPDSY